MHSPKEHRMAKPKQENATTGTQPAPRAGQPIHLDFHGVRYQARDVARSVEFYTGRLRFELEHQHLPDFGNVSLGSLKILLSGAAASGSRPMPDGQPQQPGGWNRVVLRVEDLERCIA